MCLVGVVGLFFLFFSLLEKDPTWVFFIIFVSFFHGLLELGGNFFGDFGVRGSSLDAFGARGGPGRRPCRNCPLQ